VEPTGGATTSQSFHTLYLVSTGVFGAAASPNLLDCLVAFACRIPTWAFSLLNGRWLLSAASCLIVVLC
jgi:hypothetical protein